MNKEELKNYDFVIMIDKSGSMGTVDLGQTKSRWVICQEGSEAIANKACEYDQDGATFIVFSSAYREYKNTTANTIQKIFSENEPDGGTNTADALKHVFDDYFTRRDSEGAKPMIIMVITDGKSNDDHKLATVIVDATKKMKEDAELGVSFVQIGNDAGAREMLKFLDDELQTKYGAKFDIVDTFNDEERADKTLSELFISAIED